MIDIAKINFRPHTKDDIPLRVKWLNNPEIADFVFNQQNYRTNTREQEEWFSFYEKEQAKKFFIIQADDTPIGLVGLSNITKDSADLFILIGEKEYKGQSMGKIATKFIINYAFDQLHLSQINLEVSINNQVAINLYKSLGFVEVGSTSDNSELVMRLKKQAVF